MKPPFTSFQTELQFPAPTQNATLHKEGLPWIQVAKDAPYFITDRGENWTPIGQNDAITWPEFKGLFQHKDTATAEAYIKMLSQQGVTCVRLMLEYCQGEHRYFENPVGYFQPNMIRLWDSIFSLCEKYGIRILLTPFDTFWMWKRWAYHPYNTSKGGVCNKRSQWLINKKARIAIKQRLAFATKRWGNSGALFAWDIWNEIHPAHAGNSADCFKEFVEDLSSFLRNTEIRLFSRSHLQTVSVFGPVLTKDPLIGACAFRHDLLDFASVHFYDSNTIDNPKNTIDAALCTGRLTREALDNIQDNRPFFDSEHGPIHAFKDKNKTLPEPFDDEYFLNMQWAHFASGGAGGGMRWPNRHPHSLTAGMRKAQHGLALFLPFINWQQFKRRNLNNEVLLSVDKVAAFCCADTEQAILWLLCTGQMNKDGTQKKHIKTLPFTAQVPGLKPGIYLITMWDTKLDIAIKNFEIDHKDKAYLSIPIPPFAANIAIAVRRIKPF